MTGNDPFAGVAREVAANGEAGQLAPASASGKAKPSGDWVWPVPEDALQPRGKHRDKGHVSASWAYRDSAGKVLHWVCRFDLGDGRKEILPQTLWREAGRLVWHWRAAPVPRPLFRLDALALAPAAPVLVVEGEKTAEAAAQLFPQLVAVCWSGGSKAVGKADWTPLRGRRVVVLPDADEPGSAAAEAVAKAAAAAGADGVAVVALPDGLPEGWDVADAFPAGFGQERLALLIAAALDSASAGTLRALYGYTLNHEGLFWREVRKDDEGRNVQLSDPFEVEGLARDSQGTGWAVVVSFHDRDGRKHRTIIKRGRLASEARAVRAELADAGLYINPSLSRAERFGAFLAEVEHSRRLTLADRTGWIDARRFVLPAGAIGPVDAEPTLFDGAASSLNYRQAGTLDGWQREVAARAIGNRVLAFVLSVAFVGPLARWLGLEGGGFHLRGSSSTGKTSAAVAAGSVWGGGGPQGFVASWKATGNALEWVALAHHETLLLLDEIGLSDAQEAGATAYMLASGSGKSRARQEGGLRNRAEWRVIFLSTGEISLADHMRNARRAERTMAGQELRLLDIPADQGTGCGAWQDLHGLASGAAFSDAIKAGATSHYGYAGPAFVRGLVADPQRWQGVARQLVNDFARIALREGDNGQIARAAARFGAVAAAGEIAAQLGVVPWPSGLAQRAALECFEQWAEGFGRQGAREDRQVIEVVRNALLINRSAFGAVPREKVQEDLDEGGRVSNREGEARSLKEWGYLHDVGTKPHFLINEAGWAEILKGFDLRSAADVLIARGFMLRGDGGRRTRRQRIGGVSPRFYTVCASILEWDGVEAAATGAADVEQVQPLESAGGAAWAADLDPFGLDD